MQCTTSRELGWTNLPDTDVCEHPPDRLASGHVFLNALSDMPECDRRHGMASLDSMEERAERCYVYCAQRSCGAAKAFLRDRADEVAEKCASVTYLRNGALSMREIDLADGEACHARIVAHNRISDEPCLTCEGGAVRARLSVDGEEAKATFDGTDDTVPDWFHRADVWSRLPPQFSRDPRYRNRPKPHDPSGDLALSLRLDGLPYDEDALLAFWAARDDGRVREAHDAYGDFTNSGIVQCRKGTCDFTLDRPGQYTAEGRVFRPHVHVAPWRGDHWGAVGTVAFD